MKAWLIFCLLASLEWPVLGGTPRTVHVFVALCDNLTQGIVPVPARIGNGDDADENLYWGCDDGLRALFRRSSNWRLIASERKKAPAVILEECVFKHRDQNIWVVAHAYRGQEIRQALTDFLSAAAGAAVAPVRLSSKEDLPLLPDAGHCDFLAYIGHNGLMDFRLEFPTRERTGPPVPAVVLCCKSDAYFSTGLRASGAAPALMTTQLMYPGSFLLEAALQGWMAGEGTTEWRERAARAYAANQKISVSAARGVFTAP